MSLRQLHSFICIFCFVCACFVLRWHFWKVYYLKRKKKNMRWSFSFLIYYLHVHGIYIYESIYVCACMHIFIPCMWKEKCWNRFVWTCIYHCSVEGCLGWGWLLQVFCFSQHPSPLTGCLGGSFTKVFHLLTSLSCKKRQTSPLVGRCHFLVSRHTMHRRCYQAYVTLASQPLIF